MNIIKKVLISTSNNYPHRTVLYVLTLSYNSSISRIYLGNLLYANLLIDFPFIFQQLICLFPSLITSKWTYFPSKDLHDIKDINKISK